MNFDDEYIKNKKNKKEVTIGQDFLSLSTRMTALRSAMKKDVFFRVRCIFDERFDEFIKDPHMISVLCAIQEDILKTLDNYFLHN